MEDLLSQQANESFKELCNFKTSPILSIKTFNSIVSRQKSFRKFAVFYEMSLNNLIYVV